MRDDLEGCTGSLVLLAIVAIGAALLGSLGLAVTGYSVLTLQVNIEAGAHYEVPGMGNVAQPEIAMLACRYFTGRGMTWRVYYYIPNYPPHMGSFGPSRESCGVILAPHD